jgi:pimeloyl-[acyl-carrier protein] methyl ester esterase
MTLYTQASGSGPELVLIHGWGLHGGIWDGLVPLLEPSFRVTRVDLPGHGHSVWSGEETLAQVADAVLAVTPHAAGWVGWSLGGLVAMAAALRAPQRVRALALVASTPSFLRRPGWSSAMLPALLDSFAEALDQEYARTLDRFLALQVRGSAQAGAVLKDLRARMRARAQPQLPGLHAGLEILRGSDLRTALGSMDLPVLLLAGERDTLVPLQAMRASAALIPGARLSVIEGAGHAPFLAAPERVATWLDGFFRGVLPPPAVARPATSPAATGEHER